MPPAWVPWPRHARELSAEPVTLRRVLVTDQVLEPLAQVLCEEVEQVTGARLPVDAGDAGAGDVVLRIDPSLGAGYRMYADETVLVEAGDAGGVALGTTTLVQSLLSSEPPRVPRVAVEDAPSFEYRAVMVDCARQPQSIETLRDVVRLCRFYKIGHLQLHLTDDQAFTFPSECFPRLATAERAYDRGDLIELEHFASARGVTLVPELDVPAHGAAMVRAMPEVFGLCDPGQNESLVHIGREATYSALDQLVGEMCAVFASSDYFHVGGDEASLRGLEDDPEARAYSAAHGVSCAEDLFRHFLSRMHGIVARHGKRAMVWEGFRPGGEVSLPRDLIVVAWDTGWYRPDELIEAGHPVVNASWQPLYVVGPHGPLGESKMWSPEQIWGWHPQRWEHYESDRPSSDGLEIPRTAGLLGAQICSWEQRDSETVPDLRRRLGAFAERVWNPDAVGGYADVSPRHAAAEDRLTEVLSAR